MRQRPSRQAGVATLLFTVVLLVAMTVITFMTAKTLLIEQAVSGNEYRAKEVSYAAEAALEYAIAWLDDSDPVFATWDTSDEDGNGNTYEDLSAPGSTLTAGTDTYTLSVQYTRSCLRPDSGTTDDSCKQWLVDVVATAVAQNDSSITKTQRIRLIEDRLNNTPAIDYIRVPGSWRDWE